MRTTAELRATLRAGELRDLKAMKLTLSEIIGYVVLATACEVGEDCNNDVRPEVAAEAYAGITRKDELAIDAVLARFFDKPLSKPGQE